MSEHTELKSIPNKDKRQIIMIYTCVFFLSAGILTCFMYLGKYSAGKEKKLTDSNSEKVANVQILSMEESVGIHDILKLENDFTATNQDGEEVTLQSLKGKVWVFAQFYGSCPECNKVNFDALSKLYKEHQNDPDFQIVTISVKKEEDGVSSMKNMANALSAKSDNWWFLTADIDAVNQFCIKNMLYLQFKENTDKVATGMEGEIFHDMGIAVFNANMIMKAKVDIFSPLKAGNTLGSELKAKQLGLEVAAALKALKEK